MAIQPQTDLRLLKVPFTIDNKNQLTFSNLNAQTTYFLGLSHLEINNISYQRKDSIIRYPAHIDSIIQYNYCMYQNENYTNKWFYAYIIGMRYINDGMTEILIQTDVYQTWQFDITFKESFVEREMIAVANDVPGANLEPEGFETGEFKINASSAVDGLKPVYIVAYGSNPKDDGLTQQTPAGQGMIINGVASGIYYCLCNNHTIQGLLSTINSPNIGKGESIIAIFAVPALALVGYNGLTISELIEDSSLLLWIVNDFKANPITVNLNALPTSLDGYTPRNQKLRTYPFIYLGFNPQNASEKIYRYEDFTNNTPVFKVMSEVNPNPTVCFIPQNYRGKSNNNVNDIGIMNGYPQISWVTDYFNNWLAQNGNILKLQMEQEKYNYQIDATKKGIDMAGNMVSNALTLNAVGSITDASNDALDLARLDKNHEFYIKNQMAQIEKQEMLPNTAHLGTSSTLLGYDLLHDGAFTRYSIKAQFARKIDKYFDMYGYLTNERKVPNLNNRPNWNYVKTIGANIVGNIPQYDLQAIKTMFDNGVTLWHNSSTFLDYSQNNR